MAGVEEAATVFKILVSEEYLRHLDRETLESLFIGPHQATLPHGCRGLLDRKVFRVFFQLQFFDAGDNGAGGDDQDLASLFLEGGELVGQPLNSVGAQSLCARCDEAAADFDDDPPGLR